MFAGRASRTLGAAWSGVQVITRPAADGRPPQAGLRVECNRRAPDARVFPHVRFQWGLFVGTRADLVPPDQVQEMRRDWINYWDEQRSLHVVGAGIRVQNRQSPLACVAVVPVGPGG